MPEQENSPTRLLASHLAEVFPGERLGIMIVDHGSRRAESNRMLDTVVAMFQAATQVNDVLPAHMELAEPSIADSFAELVVRGVSLVIVHPFFLLPGRHWTEDIPRLVREAATRHAGVRHFVSAPLGPHPLMLEVMADRIAHCGARLSEGASECRVCEGQGGCGEFAGEMRARIDIG